MNGAKAMKDDGKDFRKRRGTTLSLMGRDDQCCGLMSQIK